METTSAPTREGMHCGWIPRSRWTAGTDGLPRQLGTEVYESDTCPGYLVRQPEVIAAAEAYSAMEAGALERCDPIGLRVVFQAAMAAKRAFNLFEAARQKQVQARMRMT